MNFAKWLICLILGVSSVCASGLGIFTGETETPEDRCPDTVLDYWFGETSGPTLWFAGGERVDREIRERFGPWVLSASRGELDHWVVTPQGRLALIILLDQFPRNIFRNSPKAFAFDSKTRELVLDGLVDREDLALKPLWRTFFYLPLEHAEDLQLQNMCVELYSELVQDVSADLQPLMLSFLDYALRHRDVIARFGRFPHRNATMGRTSSTEEIAFLEGPNSPF